MGKLFSHLTLSMAQTVTVDDTKCLEAAQDKDGAPPRAHPLARAPAQAARARRPLRDPDTCLAVLVHQTAVCFSHVCICAELWRGVAEVMLEERASNVGRCGEGKDFSLVERRADDVGPGCCVLTHRGGLLTCVGCRCARARRRMGVPFLRNGGTASWSSRA